MSSTTCASGSSRTTSAPTEPATPSLTADQIPLEASIVAVADAFEAMTSDRVYRPGMHPDAAREELLDNAGSQFSTDVVHALLRAIDREGAPVIR